MHAKYSVTNNSSNGEAVKTVAESFPYFYPYSSLALIIKSIDFGKLRTLVLSS